MIAPATGLATAAIQGVAIAAATAALNISFWKSLVIAAVTGLIGAAGAITAALIAAREGRRIRDELEHVKRKVGANRRQQDP